MRKRETHNLPQSGILLFNNRSLDPTLDSIRYFFTLLNQRLQRHNRSRSSRFDPFLIQFIRQDICRRVARFERRSNRMNDFRSLLRFSNLFARSFRTVLRRPFRFLRRWRNSTKVVTVHATYGRKSLVQQSRSTPEWRGCEDSQSTPIPRDHVSPFRNQSRKRFKINITLLLCFRSFSIFISCSLARNRYRRDNDL